VHVDLILLDLTMPVMSGWEFLDAKVADPQLLDIPVIVVTAVGSALTQTDNPPWFDVIEKPFRLQGLLSVIERGLSIQAR
jgi:CheY-like chemotaxis protein